MKTNKRLVTSKFCKNIIKQFIIVVLFLTCEFDVSNHNTCSKKKTKKKPTLKKFNLTVNNPYNVPKKKFNKILFYL